MWSATAFRRERRLLDGDILNIDVTVILDGWHGDTSRMYVAGTPSTKARMLNEVTYQALMKGVAAVRPGATLGDIGHAIQVYRGVSSGSAWCAISAATASAAAFHAAPNVLHFGRPGEGAGAEAGHVLHYRADGQRRPAGRQSVG